MSDVLAAEVSALWTLADLAAGGNVVTDRIAHSQTPLIRKISDAPKLFGTDDTKANSLYADEDDNNIESIPICDQPDWSPATRKSASRVIVLRTLFHTPSVPAPSPFLNQNSLPKRAQ